MLDEWKRSQGITVRTAATETEVSEMYSEIRHLRAVNADLLAACEIIERWWLDGEMEKHYGAPSWMFSVRQALAKAKGDTPCGG